MIELLKSDMPARDSSVVQILPRCDDGRIVHCGHAPAWRVHAGVPPTAGKGSRLAPSLPTPTGRDDFAEISGYTWITVDRANPGCDSA